MKKIFKIVNTEVKDEGNRILRFRVTDETVDRDNEILTLTGWDIRNYKKNPVMLWAHNPWDLPIAKGKSIKISKEEGMVIRTQFPTREEQPFADVVYRLYKNKYLNAVSVGFIPNERERGENGKPTKLTKKELLEFSGVTVPSNPNAVQTDAIGKAVADGIINIQEAQEVNLQSKAFIEKHSYQNEPEELELDTEVKLGTEEPAKTEEPAPAEKPKEEKPIEQKTKKPIAKNVYDDILAIKELKTPEKREPLSTDLMESIKDVIPKKEDK